MNILNLFKYLVSHFIYIIYILEYFPRYRNVLRCRLFIFNNELLHCCGIAWRQSVYRTLKDLLMIRFL